MITRKIQQKVESTELSVGAETQTQSNNPSYRRKWKSVGGRLKSVGDPADQGSKVEPAYSLVLAGRNCSKSQTRGICLNRYQEERFVGNRNGLQETETEKTSPN